jgi:hypothetical protein
MHEISPVERFMAYRQAAFWRVTIFGLACAGIIGCGNRMIYPVEGRILDMDGNPIPELKGCRVEFESAEAGKGADGTIDENGYFRMGTERPGDGAWLGKHRVAITRPESETDARPKPRVLPERYESYQHSKLEVTVEPRANSIKLRVERLRRKSP